MAYSDTRGLPRLNPASIAAALAINSLMLAGFVMLKPDVLPKEVWKRLITYPVQPDPPKTPEQPTNQIKQAPGQAKTPTVPKTPAAQNSENDFTVTGGDEIVTGTGTDFGQIVDPIKITEPVFKNARLDPKYAGALQPHYPPGLIRAEIEGSVTVRVLVGADGRVKSVELVKSSHPDFLEATRRQALNKWRFIPATRDGEAVESWREMTVTFLMPD